MSYKIFENWLSEHIPEIVNDFNPPAILNDLESLSTKIGFPLPKEFYDLYLWHNGQRNDINSGPFYGLVFLPIEKVITEWEIWSALLDNEEVENINILSKYSESIPPKYVKPLYANKKWIPFAYDWAGNHLGVDLDPDEDGTYGQVINFGRDENKKYVIAKDIPSFIAWMLTQLKSGNYNIRLEQDGGHSFNILYPEKYHFLDALKDIFQANDNSVTDVKTGKPWWKLWGL